MEIRFISVVSVIVFLANAGCAVSAPAAVASSNSQAQTLQQGDTIARIHWVGKKRVAADTNSHDLMVVWNLPESDKLESQTLDKLSRAPWLLAHQTLNTNASASFKPLLEDILREESYSEVRAAAGPENGAVVFAIRLNPARAALWKTNLSFVLQSLTGLKTMPADKGGGWSLKKHDFPNFIELTTVGDWTLVGAGQDRNLLLVEVANRVRSNKVPYVAFQTNNWIEAHADLQRLAALFLPNWKAPANTPKLALSVSGNGEYVRTRGELNFPATLTLPLGPWNLPTNFIRGELTTFTAARGIKSWLDNSSVWQRLQLGSAPNEVFCWGLSGLPAQLYCAAPFADASNRVEQVAARLLASPVLATNELAGFQRSPSFHGLGWKGLPYLYPFLKSVATDKGNFAEAGSVLVEGNDSLPLPQSELINGLSSRTNLVYYDREFTGGQIDQWIFIGQFIRFVSHHAQLPNNSAGLLWLKAASPRVGSSGTDITQPGPSQLTFSRTSGIGFTAIELNLLVDWLESPDFPRGLHTFRAKPEPLP